MQNIRSQKEPISQIDIIVQVKDNALSVHRSETIDRRRRFKSLPCYIIVSFCANKMYFTVLAGIS